MRQERIFFYLFAGALAAFAIMLALSTTGGIQSTDRAGLSPPTATQSAPAVSRPGWNWDDIARSELAISIRESEYAFPMLESLHLIGVGLLFGSILMLDLRLIGFAARLPVRRVAGLLLPITWIGFTAQLASGILLFVAYADQYVRTVSFPLKMGLVVLGGINMLVFHKTTWRGAGKWDFGGATPLAARIAAIVSITVWVGAIVAGRWAGYERRPVPPDLNRPLEAVTPGSPSPTTIIHSRELAANAFAIAVAAGSLPEDFPTIARNACGSQESCRVNIWEVQGDQATHRFTFVSGEQGAEDQARWDCGRYPAISEADCLPD